MNRRNYSGSSTRHKAKQKVFPESPAFLFNKLRRHSVATVCISKQSKLWILIEKIPLNFSLCFVWWEKAFLQTSSFHFPRELFHFHIAPREGQGFLKSQQFFLLLNCKEALKSWQPAVLAKEKNLSLAQTVKGFCNMQQHWKKWQKCL